MLQLTGEGFLTGAKEGTGEPTKGIEQKGPAALFQDPGSPGLQSPFCTKLIIALFPLGQALWMVPIFHFNNLDVV